jgi:putative glycosyl hydrolase
MRVSFLLKTVIIGLSLFFGMPFTVSQARSLPPAPTPGTQKTSPSNGSPLYKVFLPMIASSGSTSAPLASKKGVPLTYEDCSTVTDVKGSWQYGWSPTPANCPGIENVPMIEDSSAMNATIGGNSQWLMGFNEPDLADQANLTLAQAAKLWRKIEQEHPNLKLLAPAPSGGNGVWINNFRNTYIATYGTPPRLDGLAVHCYAWYASDCINQTKQFESWASSWGIKEIWVTEFSFSPAAPSSQTQSLQEAQTYINWLTNESLVTRYAWFASRVQGTEKWLSPYFVTPLAQWTDGQLTSYGSSYASFR